MATIQAQMFQAQIWKGSNFGVKQAEGGAPGTVIFRFSGPFTSRDMYNSLSPVALRNLFESTPTEQKAAHIFDLTDMPYMDSTGLGMLVSHFVRCQGKGVRLVLAGVSPRVLQRLKMTKVENLIPMTTTVEEADHWHPSM